MSRPLLADYTRAGFALVPIPFGEKGPTAKGWNLQKNCFTDPEIAEHLDGNVGLAHAYSGTCCFDIDDMGKAVPWFADRGVAIEALLDAADAVQISSGRPGRAKLLYRVDKPLPSFKLEGFELRCASRNGLTVQDVLPPSIHPDTGKPYVWKFGECGHWMDPPALPDSLRAVWVSLIGPQTTIKPEITPERASMALLMKALKDRDPNAGYDDWFETGSVLHHETKGSEEGLALWDSWSSAGKTYKGIDDLRPHWRSFGNTDNPKTIASWRKDTPATVDEFEDISNEPVDAPVPAARRLEKLDGVRIQRNKDGELKATLPNLQYVMMQPGILDNKVAFDSFLDTLMISPAEGQDYRPIRDTDYTSIRLWLQNSMAFEPVSRDLVRDMVHWLGELHTMDSAQNWLQSLTWDGVARVERFLPKYMGTVDTDYERAVGKYLWSALAGRVMDPGCQVDMVPILVGKQGLGKSQGVRAMVPAREFYTEIRLDDKDDDIARKMRGTLIGEIAELRGLRTADLDKIKAFVTRMDEQWTPKYQEFATTFQRRLVMVGTSNDDEFLVDEENRRWLPVRTVGINVEAIRQDRDQLWAEALVVWRRNGISWKDAERLAKTVHEDFRVVDTWETVIGKWIADNSVTETTLHQVFEHALGLDVRHIGRAQEMRLGKVLRALGFDKKAKRIGAKVIKVWVSAVA